MIKQIIALAFVALLLCACSNQLLYDNGSVDSKPTISSSASTSTQDKPLPGSQDKQASPSETPEPMNESESTPKLYTYEVSSCIHENMPEYRFVASGKNIFVTSLDVYSENGASILSVTFEPESCPAYPEMMDTMGLHITDVNFDGYKDVIILNCFHGAHANSWYDCWLWDVEISAFAHSESFVNICNPALDPAKQCIYSSGGSGASFSRWDIYKYIGGEFVVSNSLSFEWLDNKENGNPYGLQVTEEALLNGKMEKVHDVFIPGDVTIDGTAYYNEEFWQLKNSRWYVMGGHHADQWLE